MFFRRKGEKEHTQLNDINSGIEYIIVGLGNPGRQYAGTRHNAGFITIDSLAEKLGVKIDRIKFKAVCCQATVGGKRVLLLKPQTFMNNSGEAVVQATKFYKIPPERTIIIFDDISLEPGQLRIRRKGSDGGQKGMRSIIYLSGSDAYPRIKMGVGAKPNPSWDLADWVLSGFKKDETEKLMSAVDKAHAALELMVNGGIDMAMNKFNS